MSVRFNGSPWVRRGWGPTQRSRVSRDGAYPWSALQVLALSQNENTGVWSLRPLPTGTDVLYNVFWFTSDVPAVLLASANGLTIGGTCLQQISPALFGTDCVNTLDAAVGSQFAMTHAAAGVTLGFPAQFDVPDSFQATPNGPVGFQAIANGGVVQGPPFALATGAQPGWTPAVIDIEDYTAAIKANNNLITAAPWGTIQVVGLFRETFTPPVPPGP